MTTSSRLMLRLIAAALVVFGLAACGPSGSSGFTLHRGNGTEPDTLDPLKSSGKWESDIIGEMFLGLATEDPEGLPVYGSAVSYDVSADGLTWTFRLREDMTWSDGVPVTAEDFIFAHKRILDPAFAAQYASLIYPIKNAREINEGRAPLDSLGVVALDAKTIRYTLAYPAPYFFELSRHQTMFPVPKHIVEKVGDDWIKPANIVVNGPYKLAEWVPNSNVRLKKNPAFYEAEKVTIEEVVFYPISDQSVEVKRYKAGEFDATNSVPARELANLKTEFGDQVRVFPYTTTTYLQVNTSRHPFTDVRLRQALSLASDREALAYQVLNAGQVPAYALVPPGMANYNNAAQITFKDLPVAERRREAVALLEAAGYGPGNPLKFELKYQESQDGRRIAVALQDMWNSLGVRDGFWPSQGVEVVILNSDSKVHYNSLRTQDFDVATAGWVADYNDPENYLFLLQSSAGQMNYSKYFNPAYDRLMEEASLTTDLAARALILQQAEQVILDDVPIIPLWFGATRRLVAPHVKGWVDNVGDRHRTRYLSIER